MTPGIPWAGLYAAATLPTDPADVSCSTWDFFFNGPAWKACQAAKSRAMQQDVVNRAQNYYGPASVPAQVAQQAADAANAQATADAVNVGDYYGAGSPIATPGQGMPTWVMAAFLVGGLLLLRNMNS